MFHPSDISELEARTIAKRRRFLWALFAWLGIPFSFVVCVSLGCLLVRVNEGGLLISAIVFASIGTLAIAKGQRPVRTWIVLIYPLPMMFMLMLVGLAVVLLTFARGCC